MNGGRNVSIIIQMQPPQQIYLSNNYYHTACRHIYNSFNLISRLSVLLGVEGKNDFRPIASRDYILPLDGL